MNSPIQSKSQGSRNRAMEMKFLRCLFLDASAMIKLVKDECGSAQMRRAIEEGSWVRTTWICVAEVYGRLKADFLKVPDEYLKRLFKFHDWLDRRVSIQNGEQLKHHIPRHWEAEALMKKYQQYKKDAKSLDFSDAMQFVTLRNSYAQFRGKSRPVLVTSDQIMKKVARDEDINVWDPMEGDLPPP